ncbi:Uncharacterised protein [Klebsiella quasipneumoniae]|jgi:hypothetical protein|nr:Uncharacterised protein [Klebsiella quasipneumoniae]
MEETLWDRLNNDNLPMGFGLPVKHDLRRYGGGI